MYSNSANDTLPSTSSLKKDESSVKSMYEFAPYPDLGAGLKDISYYWSKIPEITSRKDVKFLDAGCGTGHIVVGVAKKFPTWKCFGVDLSNASLSVARKLMSMHAVSPIKFHQGSYLDPNPFSEQFDVISALGTIHHSADPVGALKNLKTWLKDDGVLLMHLYGQRIDQGRFDIKEILSLFERDLSNYERRFFFYSTLQKHIRRRRPFWKRLLLTSPYEWYLSLKNALHNHKRKQSSVSWSPGWTADYPQIDSPWIDHFCHPCERAYEAKDVQELVEAAGLEVTCMVGHGREHPRLIPPEWREAYNKLGFWEKTRINELLSYGGGSYNLILKKKKE